MTHEEYEDFCKRHSAKPDTEGLDDAGGVDLSGVTAEDLQPFEDELSCLYMKAVATMNFKTTGIMLDVTNLKQSLMRGLK